MLQGQHTLPVPVLLLGAALHRIQIRARVCCCWYQNLLKNVVYPLSLCQLDPS